MDYEEVFERIEEDEKFGLYTIDGKWLFECRNKNGPTASSVFYLMCPKKPTTNAQHFTVGIEVPNGSSLEYIVDKIQIAKRDYDRLKHLVDLDGGDLESPNL